MFDLLTTQLSETADRQVWPARTAPAARRNRTTPADFLPALPRLDFTKPSLDREIGSRIWPGLKAAYRVIPTQCAPRMRRDDGCGQIFHNRM